MPKAINKKELCDFLQVQDAEERLMATLVKGSLNLISPYKIVFVGIFPLLSCMTNLIMKSSDDLYKINSPEINTICFTHIL